MVSLPACFYFVEWKKHGTCSGLGAEDYFKEAMRVMLSFPRTDRGTPEILKENIGKSVPTRQLQESYRKKVGIKVDKEGYLEEITSCFLKRKDQFRWIERSCVRRRKAWARC